MVLRATFKKNQELTFYMKHQLIKFKNFLWWPEKKLCGPRRGPQFAHTGLEAFKKQLSLVIIKEHKIKP
jgi:hypothetical protein